MLIVGSSECYISVNTMYGGVPGGGVVGGVPGGGVPGFQPGVSSTPSSTVELSLSCSNLRNADFFSKSDPFVVIQIKVPKSQTWTEIFRSETIQVYFYKILVFLWINFR